MNCWHKLIALSCEATKQTMGDLQTRDGTKIAPSKNKHLPVCEVGAHHQNGIAEKRIRDLSEGARTSLLHAMQRWSEVVTTNLWPFALKNEYKIANKVKIKDVCQQKKNMQRLRENKNSIPITLLVVWSLYWMLHCREV